MHTRFVSTIRLTSPLSAVAALNGSAGIHRGLWILVSARVFRTSRKNSSDARCSRHPCRSCGHRSGADTGDTGDTGAALFAGIFARERAGERLQVTQVDYVDFYRRVRKNHS